MSIAQEAVEVKPCSYEECQEDVFRDGLYFEHCVHEQADLGTGYPPSVEFDAALDGAWYGYALEEVC